MIIWFFFFKLVSLKSLFLVITKVPIINNVTEANSYYNFSKRFLLHAKIKWCSKSYLCYWCSDTHDLWWANDLSLTLKVSHQFFSFCSQSSHYSRNIFCYCLKKIFSHQLVSKISSKNYLCYWCSNTIISDDMQS